jgi:hypothetical protein
LIRYQHPTFQLCKHQKTLKENYIMQLSELTKTQFRFIIHLADRFADADTIPGEFTRSELRKHAAYGGWSWAPAWIVKDESRRTTRGAYSVPELTEYMNLPQTDRDQIRATDNPDPRVLFGQVATAEETEDEPEPVTV